LKVAKVAESLIGFKQSGENPLLSGHIEQFFTWMDSFPRTGLNIVRGSTGISINTGPFVLRTCVS
jgi:hypothetical protein